MKTIIVTTDLSDESKKAFSLASQLAKTYSSKLILLSVLEDPTQLAMVYAMDFVVLPDPSIQQQLKDKVKSELDKFAKENFGGVVPQTVVQEASGSVHNEILELAKKEKADLIVMATHGRSNLERFFLGSVTEKVLRHSACPVMVVPGK